MEDLLARFGLKKEDLNVQEQATLKNWAESLSKNTITLASIKEYLNDMISACEREISGYEYPKGFTHWLFRRTRQRHMKARLYNYIMLRDFIMAPEKARSYIEKHIKNLDLSKMNGQK